MIGYNRRQLVGSGWIIHSYPLRRDKGRLFIMRYQYK